MARKSSSAAFPTVRPMVERWKPVPGWDGYEVSNLGGVRRTLPNGKLRALKPWSNSKGRGRSDRQYPRVGLFRTVGGERERKQVRVHLMVWRAFRGEVPEGLEVNHKDLNRANAALSNLELLTRKANLAHARARRSVTRHTRAPAAEAGMAA